MSKKADTQDATTLKLIDEVNKRKAEIAKIEKPSWATNCSFPLDEENSNSKKALHVVSDVRTLVGYASRLLAGERAYKDAAKALGVDAPAYTWGGFSVADWIADIKLRIDQIQIATKKEKLEALENRLNAIITPELRREMELKAIAAELE